MVLVVINSLRISSQIALEVGIVVVVEGNIIVVIVKLDEVSILSIGPGELSQRTIGWSGAASYAAPLAGSVG